jgi:hypothetical protein
MRDTHSDPTKEEGKRRFKCCLLRMGKVWRKYRMREGMSVGQSFMVGLMERARGGGGLGVLFGLGGVYIQEQRRGSKLERLRASKVSV